MRKATVRTLCFLTFVLGSIAGCGQQQAAPTIPSVMASAPMSGATAVPVAQVVSVTFNEAMNAATINTATFLLAGPGGAAITGIVTSSGTTASFTPSAKLVPGTLYTCLLYTSPSPRDCS